MKYVFSVTQLKDNFSEAVNRAIFAKDDVIISRRGELVAKIVHYQEFKLKELAELFVHETSSRDNSDRWVPLNSDYSIGVMRESKKSAFYLSHAEGKIKIHEQAYKNITDALAKAIEVNELLMK